MEVRPRVNFSRIQSVSRKPMKTDLQLRLPRSKIHQKVADFDGVDEIEMLIQIQLLGLSGSEEEEGKIGLGSKDDDCGFYGKIVGVKSPKCGREVGRLEGWIKPFMNGGEEGKREPLRLAHLLLGKAVFLFEDSHGLAGLGFPSTMEEFLQNDPPKD